MSATNKVCMIGNLTNRIMENDKTNVEIKVGTMMTDYYYDFEF